MNRAGTDISLTEFRHKQRENLKVQSKRSICVHFLDEICISKHKCALLFNHVILKRNYIFKFLLLYVKILEEMLNSWNIHSCFIMSGHDVDNPGIVESARAGGRRPCNFSNAALAFVGSCPGHHSWLRVRVSLGLLRFIDIMNFLKDFFNLNMLFAFEAELIRWPVFKSIW